MPGKHGPRKAKPRAVGRKPGRVGPNPTTTDRLYDDQEREFLVAVERYKRERKRPFPTLSELLGIVRGMGWGPGAGLVQPLAERVADQSELLTRAASRRVKPTEA